MKYSIIIPVYNSERSLEKLYDLIHLYFKRTYEIIFVNDASYDNSFKILEKLSVHPYVKVIDLKENIGQQNAIFQGLRFAKGDIIITLDDDLQHDLKYIASMIKLVEDGCDLVYGVPIQQHTNSLRQVGSSLTGKFFKRHFGEVRVSSYRIFTRTLLNKILTCDYDFIYLSALLLRYSHKTSYLEVLNNKREFGQSGYNIRKLVRLYFNLNFYYGHLVPEFLKKRRKTDPIKLMINIHGDLKDEEYPYIGSRQLSTECHT